MPDRKLGPDELLKLTLEGQKGKVLFNGLLTFLEEKCEPSLHDMCIHELHSIVEVQKQWIVKLGREINELKKRIKSLEEKKG